MSVPCPIKTEHTRESSLPYQYSTVLCVVNLHHRVIAMDSPSAEGTRRANLAARWGLCARSLSRIDHKAGPRAATSKRLMRCCRVRARCGASRVRYHQGLLQLPVGRLKLRHPTAQRLFLPGVSCSCARSPSRKLGQCRHARAMCAPSKHRQAYT